MPARNFRNLLEKQWSHGRFVCVGLDSSFHKLPAVVQQKMSTGEPDIVGSMVTFNRAIIEATKDLVCSYKPNTAFYEAYGAIGMEALQKTIAIIHEVAPEIPVILDAKRADIGNTNHGYVASAFDLFQADAITLHPYLGGEALQPFLDRTDKGIIILCRTSNTGSGEFQNLSINGQPLYQFVARHVAEKWNKNGNCGLVVGGTYPEELGCVRELVGSMPLLIPGIGAQGGSLEKTVHAGKDQHGSGMIINSSRGIIFASSEKDFAEAARRETQKLHSLITQYR